MSVAFKQSSTPLHGTDEIASLDGIRALAVFLVFVSHTAFASVIPGGAFGVTSFFFLSGYLITTLLLREHHDTGRIDIRHFYVRRLIRLYPPLLVMLAVTYTLTIVGLLTGQLAPLGMLSQLAYFANYYFIFGEPSTVPLGTSVLWSLAVEEHYYLVFPFVLGWLLRREPDLRRIAVYFALVCLAILMWRLFLVYRSHAPEIRTYFGTDTRIDAILYGAVLALISFKRHPQRSERASPSPLEYAMAATACVLLFASVKFRDPGFRETLRYTIQSAALLPLFHLAVTYPAWGPFRLLNMPWIKQIGVYSYSIYLIHYVALLTLVENSSWLKTHPLMLALAGLALSIAFAALVERYVDSALRPLRARFRKVRPTPALDSERHRETNAVRVASSI